jgi:enoyl-CoA hydratase
MSEQSEPIVRYEVADGFATVTLDSPANRNAVSARMEAEFVDAFSAAGDDDGARAVVLTHTGPIFCAGADVSDVSPSSAEARTAGFADMLRCIVALPKPVIAKVDGHVRGAGIGLVAACDLAVAGPASTFALGEVRLGLAPYLISLTLLPRVTPRAAERYCLTGEKFDATTAAEIGLVTEAADDVDAAVAELCAALALGSPQGLAETKRLLTEGLLERFDRSVAELTRRSVASAGTDDVAEGMASFMEKRPPRWALGAALRSSRDER